MKQLAVILSLLGALMLAAQEAKTPDANRTEAARFFEEYRGKLKAVARCQNRRGPEYDALEPLINSACALDPENPHYRREAILLALSRVHGEKETQVRKVLPVHIPAYCPQILQTGFAHSGGQAADDGKLPRIQFVPVRVRLLQPKLVMAEMIGVGEVVVVQAQQVQKIGGFARRNCAAVE